MHEQCNYSSYALEKKKEKKKEEEEGNVKLKTQTRNKPNPNEHIMFCSLVTIFNVHHHINYCEKKLITSNFVILDVMFCGLVTMEERN